MLAWRSSMATLALMASIVCSPAKEFTAVNDIYRYGEPIRGEPSRPSARFFLAQATIGSVDRGLEDWQLERRRKATIARQQAIEARFQREQADRQSQVARELRAIENEQGARAAQAEIDRLQQIATVAQVQRDLVAREAEAERARLAVVEAEQKRLAEQRQFAAQRAEEDRRQAEAWVREERRLAELRQKEETERAVEAEKVRSVEAAAQRAEDDKRAAEARTREERRLAEVRQREEAARAAEAERQRLAEVGAQRKRDEDERKLAAQRADEEKRLAEARVREERRLAELRRKEEAERAAEIERQRVAEAAAQRKRDEDERRLSELRQNQERQRIEDEKRATERRLAAAPQTVAPEAGVPSNALQPAPMVPLGAVQGFSGLVADEVSRFTSDQRRLAQQRVERENRRSGVLDEDVMPDEKPLETGAGNTQLARLADPPPAAAPAVPALPELTRRDDIRATQVELKRLGCFNASANGRPSQDFTIGLETAERSLGENRKSLRPLTSEVLDFLKNRKEPICRGREGCGPGQVKQSNTCIAALPPKQPTRRAPAVVEEDEPTPRRPRQPPRQRVETPAREPAAAPGARPAPAAPSRPAINLTM